MKYLIVLGIIVIGGVIFYSCKPSSKHSDNKKKEIIPAKIVMGLSKSSCRGTCEVYDFTVDENKKAMYKGIKMLIILGYSQRNCPMSNLII